MSKWKSKFSFLIESLKKPLGKSKNSRNSDSKSSLKTAREQPEADGLIDTMDWDDEQTDEQQYEDDFDETNPSFSTLTLNQIKRAQIDNGEAPPDLPDEVFQEEEEEQEQEKQEENAFGPANPAMREYVPKDKKSLFAKLKANKPNFSTLSAQRGHSVQLIVEKLRNINVDEFFEKMYAPQNRKMIHFVFLMALFTGVSIESAQIISALLTSLPSTLRRSPPPPALNELDQLNNALTQLEDNDLFRAPRKGNGPVKTLPKRNEKAICLNAKIKSDLGIKLINTIVLQDEVKSLASVQRRKGTQYLRKGDAIPGVLEIGKISSTKVFFKNLKTRECEYIENSPKGPKPKHSKFAIVKSPKKAKKMLDEANNSGISNVGNQYKIKKAVRARMLENISEVLTQARAVQIKNPDGSLSFRMQEVVPGSIYSQLNIHDGDVISGINGNKIKNVSELMELFGKIDKIDHFGLSIKKQGIEQNLEYDFE